MLDAKPGVAGEKLSCSSKGGVVIKKKGGKNPDNIWPQEVIAVTACKRAVRSHSNITSIHFIKPQGIYFISSIHDVFHDL